MGVPCVPQPLCTWDKLLSHLGLSVGPACLVAASVSIEGTCKFPWDNFLPPGVQCNRLVTHNLELPTLLTWC